MHVQSRYIYLNRIIVHLYVNATGGGGVLYGSWHGNDKMKQTLHTLTYVVRTVCSMFVICLFSQYLQCYAAVHE